MNCQELFIENQDVFFCFYDGKEGIKQGYNGYDVRASYDETNSVSNLRSVYDVIIQKNCVCAGFEYAFKYVADEAAIGVYVEETELGFEYLR